jgi:hypothetical protein
VLARVNTGVHWTRLHTFSEVFHHLTGRGINIVKGGAISRFKPTQNDCAAFLRKWARNVRVIELDKEELLDALDKAQARSILGRGVFDYLHGLAADKAKANQLLTREAADFAGLTNAAIVHP